MIRKTSTLQLTVVMAIVLPDEGTFILQFLRTNSPVASRVSRLTPRRPVLQTGPACDSTVCKTRPRDPRPGRRGVRPGSLTRECHPLPKSSDKHQCSRNTQTTADKTDAPPA